MPFAAEVCEERVLLSAISDAFATSENSAAIVAGIGGLQLSESAETSDRNLRAIREPKDSAALDELFAQDDFLFSDDEFGTAGPVISESLTDGGISMAADFDTQNVEPIIQVDRPEAELASRDSSVNALPATSALLSRDLGNDETVESAPGENSSTSVENILTSGHDVFEARSNPVVRTQRLALTLRTQTPRIQELNIGDIARLGGSANAVDELPSRLSSAAPEHPIVSYNLFAAGSTMPWLLGQAGSSDLHLESSHISESRHDLRVQALLDKLVVFADAWQLQSLTSGSTSGDSVRRSSSYDTDSLESAPIAALPSITSMSADDAEELRQLFLIRLSQFDGGDVRFLLGADRPPDLLSVSSGHQQLKYQLNPRAPPDDELSPQSVATQNDARWRWLQTLRHCIAPRGPSVISDFSAETLQTTHGAETTCVNNATE